MDPVSQIRESKPLAATQERPELIPFDTVGIRLGDDVLGGDLLDAAPLSG